MASPTREEIQAQIAASEARADTKVAALTGEIRTLSATLSGKIDNLREIEIRDHDYNRTTRWVIVGLVLALFAGFVGVLSFGGDQWGRGLSTRDLIQATIKDYDAKKIPAPQQPPPGN